MKKSSLLFFVSVMVLIACNQKNGTFKKEASIMYEPKPLALLMIQMHDETALWKEAILKDSFDISFPTDYYGIYTLEATDSALRNEVFTAQADIYLRAVKDLVETSKEKKKQKRYNVTIGACISCHQVFCQGPIDKITKLFITGY
jgi:cytochrome c553